MNGTTTGRVHGVELGLGLIGIGRPWPTPDAARCPVEQARALLDRAIELGIRVFDTVQFPANAAHTGFGAVFAEAERSHLPVLDRPMASGGVAGTGNPFAYHTASFRCAVVLTGTTKVGHLEANAEAFASAVAVVEGTGTETAEGPPPARSPERALPSGRH
ncbi:hypothetical protein AB0D10_31880 [Kitasatospora sp. NPDC048545]|uniref:hypothetical protein n=1 Tax=Kitasatospora sp. NPDC048545 TaxID=3157208 RepID=UPI0033E7EF4F